MACNHHLGNALAIVHYKVFARQVDEQHAHLAAIVGIDGARSVQHGDAMLQGQSAAGAHLGLIARGQSNIQTSLEELALHRAQHHRLLQVGTQVHTGTQRCGIGRQLLMAAVHNFYLYHSFCSFCMQRYI